MAVSVREIFFHCDHRACNGTCNNCNCDHTNDIDHARNFYRAGNSYVEKAPDDKAKEGLTVNVTVDADTTQLDKTIEKAERLAVLLREVTSLIDSLSDRNQS